MLVETRLRHTRVSTRLQSGKVASERCQCNTFSRQLDSADHQTKHEQNCWQTDRELSGHRATTVCDKRVHHQRLTQLACAAERVLHEPQQRATDLL